jgi:hypothetical protein
MLNLYGASRVYTDVELIEKAREYFLLNNLNAPEMEFERLMCLGLLSKTLDMDVDFLRGALK